MIDEMKPSGGMKIRYTSGWPKNQNRCCHSSTSPPSRRIVEMRADEPVEDQRGARQHHRRHREEHHERVTSVAQTNSGMRLSDIPGARSLKIVVIRTIASSSADSSVK